MSAALVIPVSLDNSHKKISQYSGLSGAEYSALSSRLRESSALTCIPLNSQIPQYGRSVAHVLGRNYKFHPNG